MTLKYLCQFCEKSSPQIYMQVSALFAKKLDVHKTMPRLLSYEERHTPFADMCGTTNVTQCTPFSFSGGHDFL
jgi:hypothetical protein